MSDHNGCFQKMSFSSLVGKCKTKILRNSTPTPVSTTPAPATAIDSTANPDSTLPPPATAIDSTANPDSTLPAPATAIDSTATPDIPAPAGNNQLQIPLGRIRKATKNFRRKNQIGEGSSAHVFKGRFGICQTIAVKRFKRAVNWDTDYENEVNLLSRLNHDHIIRLIGQCDDAVGEEKIIVYEFMALGSLFDHLHAPKTADTVLDWGTRMRILAGVAVGLSYLHYVADPPVIHRDLKPTNILLGDGFHPRISGFRIAISPPPETQSSTATSAPSEAQPAHRAVRMGTLPYWAPENLVGKDSRMSDVYSFGALMLDMIIGYVPLDTSARGGVVADWVRTSENLLGMADPELKRAFPPDMFSKAKNLALRCMDRTPTSRPTMNEVVLGMYHLLPGSQAEWPEELNINI